MEQPRLEDSMKQRSASAGRAMAGGNRHSMDGQIQAGDVVVSHVNGTIDFYLIATVLSAEGDLALHSVSTMKGQDDAIIRGYEQREGDQGVWLFGGSAAAYVKAHRPKDGSAAVITDA
jgi:hypothetical protein